jgi:hypothetical protein
MLLQEKSYMKDKCVNQIILGAKHPSNILMGRDYLTMVILTISNLDNDISNKFKNHKNRKILWRVSNL